MPVANTPVKLNDDTTIPLLAFGTGTTHYAKEAQHMITSAINAGFTHLDGAQWYKNEESLGAGVAVAGKAREQLFITTKLAMIPEGKTVRDTLVDSLAKLRVDYVDLFLVHTPLAFSYKEPGCLKAIWKEMEAVKKEGLTRSIGVSNFRVEQLRETIDGAEIIPSINQVTIDLKDGELSMLRSVADRVSSVCLQGPAAHARTAETIWNRDCVLWRTDTDLPLQGWAARPRVDVYREEAI